MEKFREIIRNQGGDPRVIDDYARLPAAPDTRRRHRAARRRDRRDARGSASAARPSGSAPGRDRLDAVIDPAVGFIDRGAGRHAGSGPGDPIIEIHHRDGRGLAEARRLLEAAIEIGDAPGRRGRLVAAIASEADGSCTAKDGSDGTRQSTGEIASPGPEARQPYDGRDFAVIGVAAAAAAVCALAANLLHLPRLQPLTGLIVIMTIAYCFSTNRRAIDRRTVAWGLSLQILFALIVLKTSAGQLVFQTLAAVINHLLDFAFVGSSFVFGPLGSKAVWPQIMTKVLGARRGAVRRHLRVPGAADDHLHRGAVRHPLLLRRHADRRARLRGR